MRYLVKLQKGAAGIAALSGALGAIDVSDALAHPAVLPHAHAGQVSADGAIVGVAIFAASVAVLIAVLRRGGATGPGDGRDGS
jgi:hypothetical protein